MRCDVTSQQPRLRIRGLYSDLLYQPFFCATTPLRAEWLECSNVDRRCGLSLHEFRQQYEEPNQPVILTDVVGLLIIAFVWTCRPLQNIATLPCIDGLVYNAEKLGP